MKNNTMFNAGLGLLLISAITFLIFIATGSTYTLVGNQPQWNSLFDFSVLGIFASLLLITLGAVE